MWCHSAVVSQTVQTGINWCCVFVFVAGVYVRLGGRGSYTADPGYPGTLLFPGPQPLLQSCGNELTWTPDSTPLNINSRKFAISEENIYHNVTEIPITELFPSCCSILKKPHNDDTLHIWPIMIMINLLSSCLAVSLKMVIQCPLFIVSP